MIDVFDNQLIKENVSEINLPPLTTPEEDKAIQEFYEKNPQLKQIEPRSNNLDAWVQTYTGKKFYPLAPRIEDICIEDIAHALSMLCRFNGHCNRFYSIAEHSVLVSYLCKPENALWAVCHDFEEYTLGDFCAPLKHSGEFEDYRQYGRNLQALICKKFGLSEEEPADVKKADQLMLATEARELMSPLHPDFYLKYEPLPFKLMCLSPNEAEQLLLKRFYELYK